MPGLPTGTVTFLFTDIEGSTALLQHLGDRRYAEVLEEHQRLLRDAFATGNGHEVDTQGDAFLVAFSRARDAVATAVAAQRTLMKHPWPDGASLQVRMGLHTGEPITNPDRYVGLDVHRAARIGAAAHGGQILVSDATHGLVARDLPEGVSLRDLGDHRLKDLAHQHHLFQVVAAQLPADFPPIRSLDVLPNNLPRQLTSFIGRKKEMAEVKRLLSTAYLVTLTGSGGAGKTRLALQVAADVVEGHPNGVWLVEFAPIAEPGLVPKTVATALKVPEQPGRDMIETLVDALRPKALLLVLDNCEHLRVACADLAAALLRTCPQVRILATSREGLGVPGETLWRIPSLSVPDVRRLPSVESLVLYESVRLFVDRAMASAPEFTMTRENAAAVAQVCQRLDGIPLAIELAAARVRVLAVEQIASRLDDRFRLLIGGSRMVLPQHQTLRAAIDWSYQLLPETEQVLLRRLAVFAGGWTLEAAESVCASGSVEAVSLLDLLTSLVDKSLVLAETQHGEARYRLLETVRQYARERLVEAGEEDDVRSRLRGWCVALAEQAEPEIRGPRQRIWLQRLETEHDNLRAALTWSKEDPKGAEAALRISGALHWFWWFRGYLSEARSWFEEALSCQRDAPRALLPKVYHGMMHYTRRLGENERAKALGEEGLAIARQLGDKGGSANILANLGIVAMRLMAYRESAELYDEALRLVGEDKWLMSVIMSNQGILARFRGALDEATAPTEQALALMREVGDAAMVAYTLRCLGIVALQQDYYQRAADYFIDALRSSRDIGFRWMTFECLVGLAGVHAAHKEHDRAARLYGAAEALRETIGWSPSHHDQADRDRRLASTRSGLGEEAFRAAWAEGRAMTLEQAIEYALASAEPAKPDGRRPSAKGPQVDSLTTREREVARLIAQGQTNRQIATTLIISERTADAHVQNILNKLGVSSRAQIAAWAVERGLKTESAP